MLVLPTTSPMRDKVGRPILVGDVIAYGHALGRCAALQLGVVLELREGENDAYARADKRCRIKVHGVNMSYVSYNPLTKDWKPLDNPSYIWFPDRTVVLTAIYDQKLLSVLHDVRKQHGM